MHLSTQFLTATAVVSTIAAPATEKSMVATSTPQWTIRSFQCTCNPSDTSCAYSYFIDTQISPKTPCRYTVTGSPASHVSYSTVKCDGYEVSSSWSDQFGPKNGFSTLAITDGMVIVYPAYNDKQLLGGRVVGPDQSYAPQNLP